MPLDEHGNKWSCEACLRGHRSSKCKHFDRVMVKVPKSGRPLKQCPHGESQYCRCRRSYAIMTRSSSEAQNLCRPLYHVEGHHERHNPAAVEGPASSSNLATPIVSLNDPINPPISITEYLHSPHGIFPTQLPRLSPWPLPSLLETPSPPAHINMGPGTGIDASESHPRIEEYVIPEGPYLTGPLASSDPWPPQPHTMEESLHIPHALPPVEHQPIFDLLSLGITFPLNSNVLTLHTSDARSMV